MSFRQVLGCTLAIVLIAGMTGAQVTPHGIGFSEGMAVGLPIPSAGTGGQVGGPSNPANLTVYSFDLGNENLGIADLDFSLDVNHTYVGDLVVTLEHCGASVVVLDSSLGFPDLAGVYTLDDEAALPFDSAAVVAGVVMPGTYQPTNPLSAFDGLPKSGPWVLTIFDQFGGDTGTLNAVFVHVTVATTSVTDVGLPLPVPPTGTGGGAFGDPANTFSRTVFIPVHGLVGAEGVGVRLRLGHTFSSDLEIQLSHGSVQRYLTKDQGGGNNWDSTNSYHFNDGWAPWPPAPVAGVLPNGLYAPRDSFAAFKNMDRFGAWTLTIYDDAGIDSGTLHEFELQIGNQIYSMNYAQPGPNGPLTITNDDGIPNRAYFNAYTLFNPGATPNGWFYGLDISFIELADQFNIGFPYRGMLDACGDSSYLLNTFIPTGLPINSVGVLLNTANHVIISSAPAAYVTQ